MKKILLITVTFFVVFMGAAQVPGTYYDGISGTGYTLKTNLHNLIDGHTSVSYTPGVWNAFETTDRDNYYESDVSILDMYSENPDGADSYSYTYSTDQSGSASDEGEGYNREHSFPKSWFGGDISPMETDLFHVYPSDVYVNNIRGNLPFGEVGTANYTSDNGSLRGSCSYTGYSGTVFEPIDEFKGDFARSYFYMATRYEDVIDGWPGSDMLDGSSDQVFTTWALNMLIEWHQNDPVSQKELDRNDAVYDIQGNANPFIDHPEYVCEIWGGCTVKNEPDNHPTGFSATAASSSQIDLSWTNATGTDLPIGYLLKASNSPVFSDHSNGTEPIEDLYLSDGFAELLPGYGTTSQSFAVLDTATTYYFKIWSHANCGEYILYKLDGTAPTTEATTDRVGINDNGLNGNLVIYPNPAKQN